MTEREGLRGNDESPQGLTPAQWAAYKADSSKCIFCGDGGIVGGSFEYCGDSPSQKVTCEKCGASWFDDFTLTSVSGVEIPDPVEGGP